MAKTTQGLFDLSKNDVSKSAEAGYEFELTMPGSGESTGAFITVRGEQSPVVKQYAKKKYNEYQMQVQAAKRKGKEFELGLDEAEDLSIESATNRIISWRGIADDGVELQFSKEIANKVLRDHSWIREQILETSSNLFNYDPKNLKN